MHRGLHARFVHHQHHQTNEDEKKGRTKLHEAAVEPGLRAIGIGSRVGLSHGGLDCSIQPSAEGSGDDFVAHDQRNRQPNPGLSKRPRAAHDNHRGARRHNQDGGTDRQPGVGLAFAIALVIANAIPEILGADLPVGMDPDWVPSFLALSFIGHAILLYVFVSIVATSRDRAQRQLEEANSALASEKEKTESLLLNILPSEVADELKATGQAKAHEFEEVTILFSDFQDFTGISEHMTPKELVDELNVCFYAFDAITDRYDLEKVKTIGDAYMAASGLAHSQPRPVSVVLAALEMQEFLSRHEAENRALGEPAFVMRAGIHTGPVVAGIVGVKKFQYDIWGDTVNTASRMETSGEVGRVNISEVTYELVKDEPGIVFTPRGKVEVKGKGAMQMFFVTSELPLEPPVVAASPLPIGQDRL